MNKNLSVLISSCDAFSDLWEQHFKQHITFWQAEECPIYLVTDKPTDRTFAGMEIIVVDEGLNFPARLKAALSRIPTDLVLLTLDDYFLIRPVKAENIQTLVHHAQTKHIDYLLLYDRRKTNPHRYEELSVLNPIDLTKKYAVTLYPAIWKKSFLEKTVKDDVSPWAFEASLTETARAEGAVCRFSHTGSFIILDVVRKGKLLHKAARYFKRHQISSITRPLVPLLTEVKLWWMDRISWYAPKGLFRFAKKVAAKCGMQFYSKD